MEKIENVVSRPPLDPVLVLKSGKTTYLIGIRYSEKSTETMEDKVKRLIEKDLKKGNF